MTQLPDDPRATDLIPDTFADEWGCQRHAPCGRPAHRGRPVIGFTGNTEPLCSCHKLWEASA